MPPPLYSTRVGALTIASGASVAIYGVPAGHRLVLKNVEVSQVGGTNVGVRLRLYPSNRFLIRILVGAGVVAAHWTGSVVLHELETLGAVADGAAADVSIHGYLLTGAGAAPALAEQLPAPPEP